MTGKLERDHWHPGFCGAIELEFREYREGLEFEAEHLLSKEPLRIDMLISKRIKASALGIRLAISAGGITYLNTSRRMTG